MWMHQEVPSEGDESVQNLCTGTSSSYRTRLYPLPHKLDQDPLNPRNEPIRYDEEGKEPVTSPEHISTMSVSSHRGTRLCNQILGAGPSSWTVESIES